MLPKAHIVYGALLTLTTWLMYPTFTWFPALLLFSSSVLIDFDHYAFYVIKKKDLSLKNAYYYFKLHSTEPYQLMIFHTIEFLAFVGLLSFVWYGFYYVLIGMLFHSALDVVDMARTKNIMCREYSLIYHFMRKKKSI